jgi:threonine/homoserine/homoserine lactone efflux protein
VGIVGIPFAVSSPGHAAFWVTMAAVTLVMLPWIGVMAYFHLNIRRMLRERKRFANPSYSERFPKRVTD